MKLTIFVCCLLLLCVSVISVAPAQDATPEPQPKREKFSALAFLPSGAGPMMARPGARATVDLHVNRYTTDQEAKVFAALLVEKGPDALHKALEDAKSIGKITLTGRVGFYDFKIIRSHRTAEGRRIYAVGDRPVGFLEAYYSGRSRDYDFGILQVDLKPNKKGREEGEGALIYAAKIKVLSGNNIDIETYGISPVRLMGVRKL